MSIIKRNFAWSFILAVPVVLLLLLTDPTGQPFYLFLLAVSVAVLVLQIGFVLLKRANPAPVPDSAIHEMMEACHDDSGGEEWVLIRFRPKVSLNEARRNIGSATYSEENRVEGFIGKFQMIAAMRPDVAVYYAPNKGLLMANRTMVKSAERKYGRWMLDTWYSLNGALNREGLSTHDLDGPQRIALR